MSSSPPSSPAEDDASDIRVVSLVEFADLVGVNRETARRLAERWADFPVIERGSVGTAWRIDAERAVAFLQARRDDERREREARGSLLDQLRLPVGDVPVAGNMKPAELLAIARARQIDQATAREGGHLVPTANVRVALEAGASRLGRAMDAAIAQACRAHGVPEAVARAILTDFTAARRAYVSDAMEAVAAHGKDAELFDA